jgi:hypothetical protein
MMQSVVRELFPDYMEYYEKSENYIDLAITIPFELSIDQWREIKQAYHEVIKGNTDQIIAWVSYMRGVLKLE